jgi:hypothetical protein
VSRGPIYQGGTAISIAGASFSQIPSAKFAAKYRFPW